MPAAEKSNPKNQTGKLRPRENKNTQESLRESEQSKGRIWSPHFPVWCPWQSPAPLLGIASCTLVVQMVENLPAMQETWVQSLGQEDPLKKEMATLSSILAWRITWTEEPGGLQSMELQRVRYD